MHRERFEIAGRPATVWTGGNGAPLVLLHGGWAGAETHFGRVWDRLAERFFVIAPELPGVGDRGQAGLGSLTAYAAWIEALLDARGLEAAILVGNSFGGALACALATRNPSRVRALVLVNGTVFPRMPRLVERAVSFGPTRALLKAIFRYNSFSPRALSLSFARLDRVPDEVRAASLAEPPQTEALLDVLARGGDGHWPSVRTLLLFGEADRFPPTTPEAARKLQGKILGAQLAFVPDAGHLPQVENPDAFLAALLPFLASG